MSNHNQMWNQSKVMLSVISDQQHQDSLSLAEEQRAFCELSSNNSATILAEYCASIHIATLSPSTLQLFRDILYNFNVKFLIPGQKYNHAKHYCCQLDLETHNRGETIILRKERQGDWSHDTVQKMTPLVVNQTSKGFYYFSNPLIRITVGKIWGTRPSKPSGPPWHHKLQPAKWQLT